MDLARAFEIVMELARQNMVDEDEEPEIYAEQLAAIEMLEEAAVEASKEN